MIELLPEFFKAMKWRPSLFMPKEASRINLTITHIALERLTDIVIDEAIAEGIDIFKDLETGQGYFIPKAPKRPSYRGKDPVQTFIHYVRAINELSPYYNPWVWVVSFEVIND